MKIERENTQLIVQQEKTERIDLATIFHSLTEERNPIRVPYDNDQYMQAIQTKYMIQELMDCCMNVIYFIYLQSSEPQREWPLMVPEACVGIATFGRTPIWKRVTSANNL